MTKRFYRVLLFLLFFSFGLPSFGQDFPVVTEKNRHVLRDVRELPSASDASTPTAQRTAATSVLGTVTDASCYGAADGKIDYSFLGGAAPYTYTWSNGVSGKVYGGCSNIISITNPGAVALTNYQVMITLPYVSGMNTDFSDIIFSDTLNTQSYNYWRESYTSGIEAVFWVKVPAFPPGLSYLRASYCDAAATTQSNGPATFEYFDGFDDQDISDWTHVCQNINFPDETCTAVTVSSGTNNYATQIGSYAHCLGTPLLGVSNSINKNITLPTGQYHLDVSCRFRICLRDFCTDSVRIVSYFYINGAFASAFYLEQKGSCGCINSGWVQIRANSATTSTNVPINYDLRTTLGDCGEGELYYDNFRLRKDVVTPTISIAPVQKLSLTPLLSGNYTITVTDGSGTSTNQLFTIKQPNAPVQSSSTACAKKPTVVSVSGNYPSFHWYAEPTGGSILHTGTDFNITSLTNDSTLYVSGIGINGCETMPRSAVTASIALPSGSNGCLTIYSGISPNDDGLNDAWEIKGIEDYPNNIVSIFDRGGNLVFETTSYTNSSEKIWSGNSNTGTSKGAKLPDGTYFYDINIDGVEKPLSGFVILNREH